MVLLMLTALAWSGRPVDCATPRTYGPVVAPSIVQPPDDHKDGRDAYALPNQATSDNFAVRWGSEVAVSEVDQARLLAMLEEAWTAEVDGLGHPPPIGSDTYLFNVYLGDTGDGAPSTLGAAGYYAPDPEQQPMLVLDPGLLADDPDYLAMTVAHELYHALQAVSDRFSFERGAVGTWYWESTAVWASAQVYPNYPQHAEYLFGYALLHHEPVDTYDYFDGSTQGSLAEYYTYGSFLFPLDLTQSLDDPDLIPASWMDTSDEQDPIEVLRSLLAERGEDLDALWMRHNARMVSYDYPLGEDYERLVKAQFQYEEQDDRVVARLTSPTLPGSEVQPPTRLRPRRYGFNVLEIDLNDASTPARLSLVGLDGSEGSQGVWHAQLVRVNAGTPSYVRVDTDSQGRLTVDVDPSTYDEAYLVVGVTTEERSADWTDESFNYAVGVEQPIGSAEGGGCGCSTQASGAGAWLVLLGLLLGSRRRRSC